MVRRRRLGSWLSLVFALSACEPSSSASSGALNHPDPNRLLVDVDNVVGVARSTDPAVTLTLGDTAFHIGELDEPTDYVFGSIDALIRVDSTIALLDSRSNLLRFFGHDGDFLRTAGGPGEGPGDFLRANAIATDGSGRVYVTDVRSMRLSLFLEEGDSTLFERSVALPDVMPYDVCALGDVIVVHGVELGDPRGSRQVHVFGRDLSLVRSFGRVYDSSNSTIQSALSTGKILCVPPATVLYAPANLPFVFAYSTTGEELWQARLEGVVTFPYVEYPDRIVNPIPDGGAQAIVSLARVCAGWALLQVARITAESAQGGRYAGLDSYALNVESGEGTYLGGEVPFVLEASESIAFVRADGPFPKVLARAASFSLECARSR